MAFVVLQTNNKHRNTFFSKNFLFLLANIFVLKQNLFNWKYFHFWGVKSLEESFLQCKKKFSFSKELLHLIKPPSVVTSTFSFLLIRNECLNPSLLFFLLVMVMAPCLFCSNGSISIIYSLLLDTMYKRMKHRNNKNNFHVFCSQIYRF